MPDAPPSVIRAYPSPGMVPLLIPGLTVAMLSEPYYHKRSRKRKWIRAHILLQEHPAGRNSDSYRSDLTRPFVRKYKRSLCSRLHFRTS
jgi:hypothetical protein